MSRRLVWRVVDLLIYGYLMLVGFIFVCISISVKPFAACIGVGVFGFSIMYSAIRFGFLAKEKHEGRTDSGSPA